MFVGRKTELDSLNRSFSKNSFQFPVIYGRRRIGKTTLINEFCKGKKAIYFVAVQSTAKENLHILSAQILAAIAPDAPENPFPSFREAIEYIFIHSKNERLIFVIDEFPYLANSDKSVSSILQAAIDKHQADSKLFLILCGSVCHLWKRRFWGIKAHCTVAEPRSINYYLLIISKVQKCCPDLAMRKKSFFTALQAGFRNTSQGLIMGFL